MFITEAFAKNHKNKNLDKNMDFIYHLKQVSTTHVTTCFPLVTNVRSELFGYLTRAGCIVAMQDQSLTD